MTQNANLQRPMEEVAPVWDEAQALAGVDGDRSLLIELAKLFVQQATADLAALRQAWTQQDAAALTKAAHRLKGAVLQFSAARAHAACRRLEEAARTGTTACHPSLWAEAETEVTRLIEALQTLQG
jgi:HPt (histidine-containing phosphotransfer) domain-containing protein